MPASGARHLDIKRKPPALPTPVVEELASTKFTIYRVLAGSPAELGDHGRLGEHFYRLCVGIADTA